MEEEPVSRGEKQYSLMTEQALVFLCALCLGHRHRITWASGPVQGSTSSSGFGKEVASQGFPEKGAIALGRKGRI